MVLKNKRGWIRIVEVFISIFLITGVLVIVIDARISEERDIFLEIYDMQVSILSSIQLNDTLREDVLLSNPPVSWENFQTSGLSLVYDRIILGTSNDFICQAKICLLDDICVLEDIESEDIYVQSLVISSNLDVYSPRQLKLFCFLK